MLRIEWRHHRRRLLLPVAILPSSNAGNATSLVAALALLDTGATATAIRIDIAEQLALRQKGRRRVFTANGDIIANEYLFRIGFYQPSNSEGGDEFRDPPYVLDREILGFDLNRQFNFQVLLGMDVLGDADLRISRSGVAELLLP